MSIDNRDVLTRIDDAFSSMSKSHKKIATYIVENYENAVFMTAAKLGAELSVSESTVVRFASGLGYNGYPEFQSALEEWVRAGWNTVHRVGVKYGKSSRSEILSSVLQSDMEKIGDTLQRLDEESFTAAVETIRAAKHVYVIGLRSCEPLASFLCFYLSMIRGDVIRLQTTSTTEIFEQMLHISEDDCMIGISFPRYSIRTMKALEFAQDRNAKIITITDSARSPLVLYSSCNLLARSDMVSIVDSLVAPLSLINALVVALCVSAPEQAQANLRELERVWNNYQVDMKDEINVIEDDILAAGNSGGKH